VERRSLLRKLTEYANLPGESLPGVPLLEISGDDRILVENHTCVLEYSESVIMIRVKFGVIKISGEGMILACVNKDQLIIHGKVDSVVLVRGG